jgi:hypothetical protein
MLFNHLAVIGFILSLFVHLSTYLGITMALDYVWPLHAGIFIVFFPALILMNRSDPDNRKLFAFGMGKSPFWFKLMCLIFLIYGVFCFVFIQGWRMDGGSPSLIYGKYLLTEHGKTLRELTEAEFWHFKIIEARAWSGPWMAIYLVLTSILYTQVREANVEESKT